MLSLAAVINKLEVDLGFHGNSFSASWQASLASGVVGDARVLFLPTTGRGLSPGRRIGVPFRFLNHVKSSIGDAIYSFKQKKMAHII